jgi:hypothetical protein
MLEAEIEPLRALEGMKKRPKSRRRIHRQWFRTEPRCVTLTDCN